MKEPVERVKTIERVRRMERSFDCVQEAAELGTCLAASVITFLANVCPRFRPEELGLRVRGER